MDEARNSCDLLSIIVLLNIVNTPFKELAVEIQL